MRTVNVKIKGIAPLLMNSARRVDKTDPLNVELAELLKIKEKDRTVTVQQRVDHLSFLLALYHNPEAGPYLPAANLFATIRNAFRAEKRGKEAEAALFIQPDCAPMLYDGPRDADKLFATPKFVDRRRVRQQRDSIMRVRPIFHEWACEFQIVYNPEVIDEKKTLRPAVDLAGAFKGLGDFIPQFGRFEVVSWK
jgi:hypothetical protein